MQAAPAAPAVAAPSAPVGSTTPEGPLGEGFSRFARSADTRVVYVSSSAGDDSRDGTTPARAVASLARAAALVRDGHPDHVLLKRGDVWRDQHLGRFKSGRSAREPLVVGYYGAQGARPLLQVSRSFVNHDGHARSYQAFVGLHVVFYPADPDDPGFTGPAPSELRFVGGGEHLWVEDCKLRYAGIVVQSHGGHTYRHVTLRRNLVLDVYGPNTSTSRDMRPSGLYAQGVDGLTIEENVFDHNGWNERIAGSGANMFCHNMYLQTDNVGAGVVVRANIITRGASHGTQGRPGGLYEDNLFVANAIGLQLGYRKAPLKPGTFAYARNNVILDGRRMDPGDGSFPRSSAVWGLYLDEVSQADVRVEGNVVAHRRDPGSVVGIQKWPGVKYTGNVSHRWGGGLGDTPDPGWPDPRRTVGSYLATLGEQPATLEGFLARVRKREVGSWDGRLGARAVNAYVRAGFGL